MGDHQREKHGSVVQELNVHPSWNFSFFISAVNKAHTAGFRVH
jgi:hypothetical protein